MASNKNGRDRKAIETEFDRLLRGKIFDSEQKKLFIVFRGDERLMGIKTWVHRLVGSRRGERATGASNTDPKAPGFAGESSFSEGLIPEEATRLNPQGTQVVPKENNSVWSTSQPSRGEVSGDMFTGRKEELDEILRALNSSRPPNLLLIGTNASGKTSLLRQLPRRLDRQILPLLIDCQTLKTDHGNSASAFLIGLAEEVVTQSASHVEKFGSVDFPPIDRPEFEKNPYPAWSRWLIAAERKLGPRTLLLCLDGFEKLEELIARRSLDERFLGLLRNILQHGGNIRVLLSGARSLDELPSRWADHLVNTQTMKLSFLKQEEARELIVNSVEGSSESDEPKAVDKILELTHAQPYLVQLLCGLLREKMKEATREPINSRVTVADVDAVKPLALTQGAAYFQALLLSEENDGLALRVLEKLATSENECVKGDDIKTLNDDQDALRSVLRTLLKREILEKTDEGYRFVVPLVREYVREGLQQVTSLIP